MIGGRKEIRIATNPAAPPWFLAVYFSALLSFVKERQMKDSWQQK
jgi:hypothetical protein